MKGIILGGRHAALPINQSDIQADSPYLRQAHDLLFPFGAHGAGDPGQPFSDIMWTPRNVSAL